MKVIFFLALIFIFSSTDNSIEGNWMRVDDEWAGMVVSVSHSESGYSGKVIYVPTLAYDWGFRRNDIKWKLNSFLEGEENSYLDLYINKSTDLHYYKESVLMQISKDTLETRLIKYDGEYIGKKQRWIRVSDHNEM